MRLVSVFVFILTFFVFASNCTDESSDDSGKETTPKDDEEEEEDNTPGSLAILLDNENPIAKSIPYELQVTSPTQADGTSINVGSLAIESELYLTTTSEESYVDKVSRVISVMISDDATACKPSFDFTPKSSPSCANQLVTETAASVGTTSDLVYFPDNVQSGNYGSEPEDGQGRRALDDATGIIAASEGDDACSPAVAEYFVTRTTATIDKAMSVMAGMMCAAKAEGLSDTLPTDGESLDLKSAVETVWNDASLDIKQAKIINNSGAYRVLLTLNRTDSNNDQTLLIIDSQTEIDSEDATLYDGRVFIYDQRRENGVTTPTLITLLFEKETSSIKVKARETGLSFDTDPRPLIGSDLGLLDYAAVLALDNNNAMGPSQSEYVINTDDGTGSVAYMSSPSLHSDEVAQSFIVTVEKDADNNISGCGIHGHTTSLVNQSGNAVSAVDIKGKFCLKNQNISDGPNYGSNLSLDDFANTFPYVQKQCFARNAAGNLAATESKLAWVVAEGCGYGTAHESEADLATLADGLSAVTKPSGVEGLSAAYDNTVDYSHTFE